MVRVIRQIAIATTALLAIAGLAVAPAAATPLEATDPGPPLRTPTATLQSALSCSADLTTAAKTPILLVPGTIESSESAYSWGYQKVLRAEGHPVCVIKRLPDYGTGDMQTTTEWFVHAVRHMYSTSGRKVSVIAHSQGAGLAGWALRFWPDMTSKIDDAVMLGGAAGGTKLADWVCGGSCPPALWQSQPKSNFLNAMNRFPLPAGTSVTSIGSTSDELIFPAPSSTRFNGATNLMVQDLCPGRTVGHVGLLWDAATHALVMDALTHAGPTDLSRTGTSTCAVSKFAGIDTDGMTKLIDAVADIVAGLWNADYVGSEPPLRDYALGDAGDSDLTQGRTVHVSSTQSNSYPASNAVDGKFSTRWSSQWSDPQWIAVDLGARKTVNGVQLQWERAYAKTYKILVSHDGSNWTTAWSTSSGRGGNVFVPLEGVAARYIAMYGLDRDTWYGYSLWEFTAVGR